ncbi:hypothetical protein I4F81_011857 [Pyropia yezoensis]|uniref:Uncharacterized protein n=1 Tax=Pyropia yezoensis TaxID=2788 RepID=A0ACC3CH04_PYRYE|nr:hypothetical protein I4F81_011857 [Neopyropia yezoensis]
MADEAVPAGAAAPLVGGGPLPPPPPPPAAAAAADAADAAMAAAAAAACTRLVLFDFDRTLFYAANSDEWVFEELAPDLLPLLHQRVRATGAAGWTAAINWALGALPPRGIPAGALLGALRRAPWPADATVLLRRLAATPGVQVGIVSDANAAYIDTILDAAGLGGGGRGELLGAGVATNGAAVSPAGGLTVVPYTAGRQPHGCGRCPPNICKGEVVTELLQERPNVRQVVYVGDGSNDVCPVLRLGPADIALARQGMAMERELADLAACGDPALRARVTSWSTPADLLGLFRALTDPPAAAAAAPSA